MGASDKGDPSGLKTIADFRVLRAQIQGSLTRIKKFVDKNAATLTSADLETRLGLLETYFQQFLVIQTKIEELDNDELNTDKGELIEEIYCETKSKIVSVGSQLRRGSIMNETQRGVTVQARRVNIPKLQLPKFSGKYTEWLDFYNMFNTLIHEDDNITDIEKFQHLRSCLSESALQCIQSIRVTKGAVNSLRQLIDSLDSLTVSILEEKLDRQKIPSWPKISVVLENRCIAMENVNSNRLVQPSSSFPSSSSSSSSSKHKSSFATTTVNTNQQNCNVCSKIDHNVYKCSKFLAMSPENRFKEAKQRALCINCLNKNHTASKCSSGKCRICHSRHHTLLHMERSASSSTSTSSLPSSTSSSSSSSSSVQSTPKSNEQYLSTSTMQLVNSQSLPKSTNSKTSTTTLNEPSLTSLKSSTTVVQNEINECSKPICNIFLATAVVQVKSSNGNYILCRAMLDSASQLNFITEHLAQQLRLKRSKVNVPISGISNINTRAKHQITVTLKSRINHYTTDLDTLVLHTITENQPNWFTNIIDWNIPSGIQLADPLFYQPHQVDMLIGAGTFFELLSVGQIKLNEHLPILQKTILGWIVSGNFVQNKSEAVTSLQVSNLNTPTNVTESVLDKLLQSFWEIENHEQLIKKWSENEKLCEDHFIKTVNREEDGRIVVSLPFKENTMVLGNSFEAAKRRFLNLERRLNNNIELKQAYTEFINEYISLNHMELVTNEVPLEINQYYLPHHCVVKPESTSTKLRVVFDGSSKTTSGVSLNDIMHVGPTIQSDLFSILLRFRFKLVAITADICKMYRQVKVREEDSNFQCILWRNNLTDSIQTYRLKTITYGTAAAPFLAIRSLHYLAELSKKSHPIGSKIIQTQFYVDDMLAGANSVEEAHQIIQEVTDILNGGKFVLSKWASNRSDLLSHLPTNQQATLITIDEKELIKTLGLSWEPKTDSFHFRYNNKIAQNFTSTKRQILSEIATLFDPLGLINPIVVLAKIFMQRLWQLKVHWDESLPLHYISEWEKFRNQLPQIINITVPRTVITLNMTTIELHGFADASLRAYGCCLYLRCVDSSGAITVKLIAAKSRVAPIKVITIPKLELCGAQLLAQFLSKVLSSLNVTINQTFCWTDSEIVLDWLSAHPSDWSIFVSNRVATIQDIVPRKAWSHVATRHNPADLVSRGVLPLQLINSKLWFSGPEFLSQPSALWPKYEKTSSISNAPERRKATIMVAVQNEDDIIMQIKFNSFCKIRRTFAYIQRFVTNLKLSIAGKHRLSSQFTPSELEEAMFAVIRIIQHSSFASELYCLKNGMKLHRHSHLITLNPFIDTNNIICVGGRLENADISNEEKHQMLLPKKHIFTTSLITHFHFKFCHAGPQALCNIIRHRFWILSSMSIIKSVVHNCISCFRHKPILLGQLMGNLPKERVQPARPFMNSGVDFCGPIHIHYKIRGKHPYKAYIAVFVCFATKATHLEIVTDLTTDAFIGALKRFIARRGFCKLLSCDNATNFVGARRELAELRKLFLSKAHNDIIQQFCAEDNIKFSHIPPRSPHFGGLWEAAVKSAKHLLYRSTLGVALTHEQALTVITQVEAILNSRPITAMSSDPLDYNALTPGHFLIGGPLTSLVEPNLQDKNISHLANWRLVSSCQQRFWTRWRQEYLNQLQQRHKWVVNKNNICLNSLVLIAEDNLPPQKWLMGRIIELHAGSDTKVRVATVRTAHGTFKRSITKLAPLPLNET